jgi:hypothetical protein
MYRINNFEVGDYLYKYDGSEWKYKGRIATVNNASYGIRNDKICGIVMINKSLCKTQGYIACQHTLDYNW